MDRHTVQYITVKVDSGEIFQLETATHKYLKAPAWVFYTIIITGKKGPAVFWEKG